MFNGFNWGFGEILSPLLNTQNGVWQFDDFLQTSYSATVGAAAWENKAATAGTGSGQTIRPATAYHGGLLRLTTGNANNDDRFFQANGAPFLLEPERKVGIAGRFRVGSVANTRSMLALHAVSADATAAIATATSWNGIGFFTSNSGEVQFRSGNGAAATTISTGVIVTDNGWVTVSAELQRSHEGWIATIQASPDVGNGGSKRSALVANVPASTTGLTLTLGARNGTGSVSRDVDFDWAGALASR